LGGLRSALFLFHKRAGELAAKECYNLEVINPFVFIKKEDVVVLDIRDGSVGGMILTVNKEGGGAPIKVFSVRKEIPFQRSFNNKRLLASISQAVAFVALAIRDSGFKIPSKVFCILGPHLHASQVRIIKSKYDKPVTISEEVLHSLILQDSKEFQQKHLLNTNASDSPNVMMEHKITQIKLNGYETSSPIKKNASEIEISVFVSMAPGELLDSLKKNIFKNLHTNKIDFHSFTFALSDIVRKIAPERPSFVVVNIEDEISEVSVIRDGEVEDIASFPVGMSMLTRVIMDRFNLSNEQALSYLKLYLSGSAEKDLSVKMVDAIDRAMVLWTDHFYETLRKISFHRLLPDIFYIATEETCKDVFINFIQKAEVSGLLVTSRSPRVECLEPNLFAELCKNISSCPDELHLLVDAIFIDKFYRQNIAHRWGEEKRYIL